MRQPLVHSAVFSLLFLAACSGDDQPGDLTARLGEGQARAGVITKEAELIGGPTAEGELGDLKIYNSKIAVIVEKPGPSDGYGTYGGTIIDADVIRPVGAPGASNFGEMLSVYNLRTPRAVKAEVVQDGREGGAAIVRVTAEDAQFALIESVLGESDAPRGLVIVTDYILEPDTDVLKIVSTLQNPGDEVIHVGDHFIGFSMGDGLLAFLEGYGFDVPEMPLGTSPYYAAVNDKVSYSFLSLEGAFSPLASFDGFMLGTLPKFRVDPKDDFPVEMFLVVGPGDLAVNERAHRRLQSAVGMRLPEVSAMKGTVRDGAGKPVASARVHIRNDDDSRYLLRTLTAGDGGFSVDLPAGTYVVSATLHGRDPGADVTVTMPSASPVALTLPDVGTLAVHAGEGDAVELPVKVHARRTSGVVTAPATFGEPKGAKGYERVEFLAPGRQKLAVPPGQWEVTVTRGTEYEAVTETVTVEAGAEALVMASMRRSVDSEGWLCGDFHIHSQFSPDSDDLLEHKVRAIGAEGLEVPVSSEHGAVIDLSPVVKKLGYEKWVASVVGEEVSTTTLGHINRFPLVVDRTLPNGGAIDWFGKKGPAILEEMRQNPANPIVQLNHPRSGSFGSPFIKGYFSAVGLDTTDFSNRNPDNWSLNFDAMEVANRGTPDYEDWFAFLDRGLVRVGTGNSDSHVAIDDIVGYPRNCVFVGQDDPAAFDQDAFVGAFRAGRVSVSGGFFVELGAGEKMIGDLVPASQAVGTELSVQVKVQAPTWLGAAKLEIVVDGEVVASRPVHESMSANAVRVAAEFQVPVPLTRDAWIVARVVDGGDLAPVSPGDRAFGFTNPLFFDGDGDGRFTGRLPAP